MRDAATRKFAAEGGRRLPRHDRPRPVRCAITVLMPRRSQGAARAARWLAIGAAAVAVAAAGATSARAAGTPYVDGISDQNVPYWNGDFWNGGPPVSAFGRLLQSELAQTPGLRLRYARYVVAYDVMCDQTGPAFATFKAWLNDVQSLGLVPDVGFWYGNFDGNRCPGLPLIPQTAAQYNGTSTGGAVAALLARFPQIRTIEPWNEPNDGRGPDVAPATAAAFWLAVHADCGASGCDAVIAGDFSDSTHLASYEHAYVAALGGVDPGDWGIHPYTAVNRLETKPVTVFQAELPSPPTDRVWYTEVGAFYCTRKMNPATGASAQTLEDYQQTRARYLVHTLMAPPLAPVHVFYYEFMFKNNVPGPCVTNDTALFEPNGPPGTRVFRIRPAEQDVLPPILSPPVAPIASAGSDWQIWIEPWWRQPR